MKKITVLLFLILIFGCATPTPKQRCINNAKEGFKKNLELCSSLLQKGLISPYEAVKCGRDAEDIGYKRLDRCYGR